MRDERTFEVRGFTIDKTKFKLIGCALPVVMSLEAMDRALEQHFLYEGLLHYFGGQTSSR